MELENRFRASQLFILYPVGNYSLMVANFGLPIDDGRFRVLLKREVLPPQVIVRIEKKYFTSSVRNQEHMHESVILRVLNWMKKQAPRFGNLEIAMMAISEIDPNDLLRQDIPLARVLTEKVGSEEVEAALNMYNLLEEGEGVSVRNSLLTGSPHSLVQTLWEKSDKV